MTTSYIPPRDADFNVWISNFSAVGAATPSVFGLTTAQVTAIGGVTSSFSAALLLSSDPSTRTPVTVAAKDTARANAELIVRPIAVTISRNAGISNGHKAAIGVTIPIVSPSPVPAPVTAPSIILQSAVIGLLNLAFRDSTSPTVRAKPVGVVGCEVWASVGTVPATDPSQCSFSGIFTKTPLQLPTGPQGGKVVTVFARWSNRSGPGGVAAVGPWSGPLTTYSL
jgi:hypothetical protein